MKYFLISLVLISFSFKSVSGDSSFVHNASVPDRERIRLLNYSVAGSYALGMTWLYTQWYKDFGKTSFHFFNDNNEWEGMDKYGHVWSNYNIAKPISICYRWAGMPEKKAVLIGSGISFLFHTTIEMFDAYSKEWGFSGGDMAANAAGIGLYAFQQLHWKEQRIVLKYSFHKTSFPKYRPELLGEGLVEQWLKDYNGQTYWITFRPKAFFKNSGFPSWLGLAIGLGAEGMTGGKSNPSEVDGRTLPTVERYRQYYLSLDVDLSRVKTKSQFLNSFFKLINIIHLPAPAIEFGTGRKTIYRGLYF